MYNKRLSSTISLIVDNASTNRAFSRLVGPAPICFYSHRYNLAVRDYFRKIQVLIDRF